MMVAGSDQTTVASQLGVSRNLVNMIMTGKRGISDDIAIQVLEEQCKTPYIELFPSPDLFIVMEKKVAKKG